jgi:hypothetical protein
MADISNRDIAISLQHMAWERAKGELRSMLHTFWPEYDSGGEKLDNGFDRMERDVENFISEFEGDHI